MRITLDRPNSGINYFDVTSRLNYLRVLCISCTRKRISTRVTIRKRSSWFRPTYCNHSVADPGRGQSRPWPPIQSDSLAHRNGLAINSEFDIIRKKCMQCGRLSLRKISKIGATRRQILRLKCTKCDFRWGSASEPRAPEPAEGTYSAPPESRPPSYI